MKDIEDLARKHSKFYYTDPNGNDCYDYFEFSQDGIREFAKALQGDVGEPIAWMFTQDLKAFETQETTAVCYSVKVSSPDDTTVPLFTSPPNTQARLDKAIEALNFCRQCTIRIIDSGAIGKLDRETASEIYAIKNATGEILANTKD